MAEARLIGTALATATGIWLATTAFTRISLRRGTPRLSVTVSVATTVPGSGVRVGRIGPLSNWSVTELPEVPGDDAVQIARSGGTEIHCQRHIPAVGAALAMATGHLFTVASSRS